MLSDSISPGSKENKMKILLGGAQDNVTVTIATTKE
jgi:hypothetical protein